MTTTVSAGSTASFQLGPFDTITLSSANGVGRLVLTSQAPKLVADQSLTLQNGTFGPWGAPMYVVLTVSQGSAGYDVNARSLTVDQTAATQALVSRAGNRAEISRRIAAAWNDNPLTRTPMTVAPDWVLSTAYVVGQRVKNGGQEYVCRVAGTSAGAGGPSGTSVGDIIDNTATWQWVQPVRATGTTGDAPSMSIAAKPAQCLRQFRAIEEASSFAFYGGVATASSASGIVITGVSSIQAGTVVTTTPGKDNCNPCIHFMTDAQVFAVEGGSFMTPLRRFIIEIDGVLYSDAPYPGNSANQFLIFDFSGKPIKPRSIKIYWRRGAPEEFRGVWVAQSDAVWAPVPSPRMVVLGDSFTAGSTYGGSANSGEDWPSMVGQMLGIDDIWNIGQGSSGFVVTVGGTRYTWLQRLTDATTPNPDILVIAGCHNDNAETVATEQAAILAYLQAFRAACPNALIICFGVWRSLANSSAGGQTAIAAMESAMSGAVTAFADANTIFVPVNSDPAGKWRSGTVSSVVTGITNAASAVITCTNTAAVGDIAVCHNINGMVIDGVIGRVTAASGSSVTVNINSTALGTFSASGSSFVAFNDIYTSEDTLHPVPIGVRNLAHRYAQGIRNALRQLLIV
jgi:lysophospholipase L1-like esterase